MTPPREPAVCATCGHAENSHIAFGTAGDCGFWGCLECSSLNVHADPSARHRHFFIPQPAPAAPPPAAPPQEQRTRDGSMIHDGAIYDPSGCPRGLTDCQPLARYASPGAESYMCCGQTASAPVPTDRLRLCIRSTHKAGVDILVNMDERDVVHTSAVLMGGLASLGSVKIIAHDSGEGYDAS